MLGLLRLLQAVPPVARLPSTHPGWLMAVASTLAFAGARLQLSMWMKAAEEAADASLASVLGEVGPEEESGEGGFSGS